VETLLVGDHGKEVHGLGLPSDLASFLKNSEAKGIARKYKARLKIG
jgi:hypothetical protein